MKTKTAFTTAAILFAFSTGSALAFDTKSVIENLPNPSTVMYCKIATHGEFEKYQKINSHGRFSYLKVDKRKPGNEGVFDHYLITHKNPVFLMSHVSRVAGNVGIESCEIFSEDISHYKSTCEVRGEGLGYAIELYAEDQHRLDKIWHNYVERGMVNEHSSLEEIQESKLGWNRVIINNLTNQYYLVRSIRRNSSEVTVTLASQKNYDPKLDPYKVGLTEENMECWTLDETKEK